MPIISAGHWILAILVLHKSRPSEVFLCDTYYITDPWLGTILYLLLPKWIELMGYHAPRTSKMSNEEEHVRFV